MKLSTNDILFKTQDLLRQTLISLCRVFGIRYFWKHPWKLFPRSKIMFMNVNSKSFPVAAQSLERNFHFYGLHDLINNALHRSKACL